MKFCMVMFNIMEEKLCIRFLCVLSNAQIDDHHQPLGNASDGPRYKLYISIHKQEILLPFPIQFPLKYSIVYEFHITTPSISSYSLHFKYSTISNSKWGPEGESIVYFCIRIQSTGQKKQHNTTISSTIHPHQINV